MEDLRVIVVRLLGCVAVLGVAIYVTPLRCTDPADVALATPVRTDPDQVIFKVTSRIEVPKDGPHPGFATCRCDVLAAMDEEQAEKYVESDVKQSYPIGETTVELDMDLLCQ